MAETSTTTMAALAEAFSSQLRGGSEYTQSRRLEGEGEQGFLHGRSLATDMSASSIVAIVLGILLGLAIGVIVLLWFKARARSSRNQWKYASSTEEDFSKNRKFTQGPDGDDVNYEADAEGDTGLRSESKTRKQKPVSARSKTPQMSPQNEDVDMDDPNQTFNADGALINAQGSTQTDSRNLRRRGRKTPNAKSNPEDEFYGRINGLSAASVFGIDLTKLKIGPTIGMGANGRVFRATYLGSAVAVKEIMSFAPTDDVEQHFMTELEALRRLRHPHVVELYGAAVSRSLESAQQMRYLLVTELAPCSLRDLLDSDEVITFKQALRLATELSKGCAYIHAMKVVHFDIKPANVLLSDSGKVKICDLGVSRLGSNAVQQKGGETGIRGTPTYVAPEIMRGKTTMLSYGVDVYSFSILFWELLHRRNPFPKSWTLAVLFNRVLDGYRPTIGPLVPARLRRLIMQCWDPISIRRPEFEQILVELAWADNELRHPEHAFLSTHLVEVWFENQFRKGRISRNVGMGNYEVVLHGEIEERTFPASEIVLTDGGGGVSTTKAVAAQVEGRDDVAEDGIVFHVVNDEGPHTRSGGRRQQRNSRQARSPRVQPDPGGEHRGSGGNNSDAGGSDSLISSTGSRTKDIARRLAGRRGWRKGDTESSEGWQTTSTGFTTTSNTPTPTSKISGSSGTDDLLSDEASWTKDNYSVDIEGIRIGEYGIMTPTGQDEDDNIGGGGLSNTHRGNFRVDLVMLNEIGRGASGVVHRALQLQSFQLVALKSIRVKDSLSRYQIAKEIRALDAVVKTSTANEATSTLTQMFGAYWEPEDASVRIVLEYMDGGSCDDMLINWRPPSEHMLAAIAIGTLKGMQQLHSSFRLHRDIKPANILIDKSKGAKLSDLGLARDLMAQEGAKDNINDALAETFVGTISYMSPERLEGKSYSYAADVWALGITLTALGLGRNPFRNYSFFQLLEHFQESTVPEIPALYSDLLHDFIAQCTQKAPQDRPTTEQLLNHPWVTQYERGEKPDPLGFLRQYITEASEGSRYKRNDLNYIAARVNEHLRQYVGSQNNDSPTQVVVPLSKVRRLATQLDLPTRHVIKGFKTRK